MKLFPHAQSCQSANPNRLSSVGGHVRSLAASAMIHCLLVASLITTEPAGGSASASRAERPVSVNVRGVMRRPAVFSSSQAESDRPVESVFVEPASYELIEAAGNWDFGDESVELVESDSRPELQDVFARVSMNTRLVTPEAVEVEEFADLLSAVERREPEVAEPEAANAEPEVGTESSHSDEVLATIIMGLPPVYPKLAIRMGWEGRTICSIEVGADGRVVNATVKESSGYKTLDEAALEAVRKWKFQAGSMGGLAARTTIEHTIHFELMN